MSAPSQDQAPRRALSPKALQEQADLRLDCGDRTLAAKIKSLEILGFSRIPSRDAFSPRRAQSAMREAMSGGRREAEPARRRNRHMPGGSIRCTLVAVTARAVAVDGHGVVIGSGHVNGVGHASESTYIVPSK
jgi:hypothetical protein